MHDINLLRPLIEQEQQLSKSRGRSGFYITFTIILILIISGLIFGAKLYLSSRAKSLDNQIASLEREVAEVKKTEDKINDFNNIISQLKNLDKNKLNWSTIYDNLAKSTPVDLKLNQVSLVAATAAASTTASSQNKSSSSTATNQSVTPTASPKLKITGEAKSRRAIALFVYKLQKVGGNFISVDIISSQAIEAQAQPATTPTSGTTTEKGAAVNLVSTEAKINFEINITLKTS